MPRASWKGFLRLSLVSCPVYLSPATTRTKAVRLRQVWVPGASDRVAERAEVRKGYEFERGQFVTFTPAELKALDVESSRTIDLTTFVPRAEVDPIYLNAAYYVYPDGAVAVEPYRVISAAMAEAGMAGLGRLTLSRR